MNKIRVTALLTGLSVALILGLACQESPQQAPAAQSSSPAAQPAPAPRTASQAPASAPAPTAAPGGGLTGANPFAVRTVKLAAGTVLKVLNARTLSTASNATGDAFDATLDEPVTAPDGAVIVPKGAALTGKIVLSNKGSADSAPKMVLTLDQLTMPNGDALQLKTSNVTVEPTSLSATPTGTSVMPSSRSNEAELNGQSSLQFTVASPVTITAVLK